MRSSRKVDSKTVGHFTDPSYLVLASLAGGPKHGHAMLTEIETMSGSRPGPGTLYGAIARLEKLGWIEGLESDDRRRPYRLTKSGAAAFAAKTATFKRIVSIASARLAQS